MMSWHLKTCTAASTEECKGVLLNFTTDFRKLGGLLRKWFPSLSSNAVPIIDRAGRGLIIFKPCSAMPALKLLAHRRTQLSSCLAEQLQQGSRRVVPERGRAGPLGCQDWGIWGWDWQAAGNLPWKKGCKLQTPPMSWEPLFLFLD